VFAPLYVAVASPACETNIYCAPCGAWLYSLLSREELGGMFLGLMAYLKPKGGWDKSMFWRRHRTEAR
jgi:hypothetical protein